jgi:hypothetical protein
MLCISVIDNYFQFTGKKPDIITSKLTVANVDFCMCRGYKLSPEPVSVPR